MRWLTRDLWKAGIVITGMLLLLVLMVWVPVSAADEGVSGLVTPVAGTVQATPTEDATVTELNKEKLAQEVKQLKQQNEPDLLGLLLNGTFLLAVGGGIFAIVRYFSDREAERKRRDEERQRWLEDRKDEREKRAEERFQSVVEGLSSEREEAKVGAAIMLRTFLRPGYEQFYTQTFDLAIAHLRLPRTSHSPEDEDAPLPLTTLSQALIAVFKEVFPLARSLYPKGEQPLVARGIQLDNAYLEKADLEGIWMPQASLRNVDLNEANLSRANLSGADLRGARLSKAKLVTADLSGTDFREAKLIETNLSEAKLIRADLREAFLFVTDLSRADLSRANLSQTRLAGVNLEEADLRGVDLSETIWSRATLSGTIFPRGNNLSKAKLGKAKLNGANLSEAYLNGADLFQADLSGAKLSGANLEGAYLNGANLNGADLSRANLRNAWLAVATLLAVNLSRSNLTDVNLTDTNLSGADLSRADLGGANLENANFTSTDLSGTNLEAAESLKNTDLRGVKGLMTEQLEACKAKGAIIGEDLTTNSSQSNIPTPPPSENTDSNNASPSKPDKES